MGAGLCGLGDDYGRYYSQYQDGHWDSQRLRPALDAHRRQASHVDVLFDLCDPRNSGLIPEEVGVFEDPARERGRIRPAKAGGGIEGLNIPAPPWLLSTIDVDGSGRVDADEFARALLLETQLADASEAKKVDASGAYRVWAARERREEDAENTKYWGHGGRQQQQAQTQAHAPFAAHHPG